MAPKKKYIKEYVLENRKCYEMNRTYFLERDYALYHFRFLLLDKVISILLQEEYTLKFFIQTLHKNYTSILVLCRGDMHRISEETLLVFLRTFGYSMVVEHIDDVLKKGDLDPQADPVQLWKDQQRGS